MDNSSDDFNIQIFISEDMISMPQDGLPFTAAYSIDGIMKYVILQGEEEKNGKQILVKYRDENEDAYLLIEDTADLIVFWDDSIGWQDSEGNLTSEVIAIGTIVEELLRGNGGEEIMIDEGPDPLREFEGFYVITKDDGSYPVLYDITIKGEMPDADSPIGHYTVVYSDGNTRIIDWKEDKPHWIERGNGVTAHSLSVGSLIEKHFEPKE